ncbi:XRE family transcriptional regulator, partial [Pseudomonas sp. MWU12-2534b]
MNIGTRIKQERQARGWSQGVLAQRAGVSKTLISEIENDPLRSTTKLVQIARALRVN